MWVHFQLIDEQLSVLCEKRHIRIDDGGGDYRVIGLDLHQLKTLTVTHQRNTQRRHLQRNMMWMR